MSSNESYRERWLANLKAAGIEPDDETLELASRDVEERQAMFLEVLERIENQSSNPDYLRDTVGEERADGDA